jgi:hypothetical protein
MAWSPYSLTWNTSDSRTSRPSWPSPPLIPLANRPSVSLSELRDEILALDIPRDNPDYDIVVDACRRSGCEPRPSASSVFHDAWEGAVHTEGYVGLTGRTALHATHRELRLLTVEDGPTFPLDLIWLTNRHAPTSGRRPRDRCPRCAQRTILGLSARRCGCVQEEAREPER